MIAATEEEPEAFAAELHKTLLMLGNRKAL
jgi:hypothetical protein